MRGDEGFDLLSFISVLVDKLCTALSAKVPKDPDHPFRCIGCHNPFCYQNFRDRKPVHRVTIGEIVLSLVAKGASMSSVRLVMLICVFILAR